MSPLQVEGMFVSLCSPDGSRHPEKWVPRTEHPSLPSRPTLWPTPRLTYQPLASELQLNPFLVHRIKGRPPIHFDLRMRVEDILLDCREQEPPPSTSTNWRPGPAEAGPSTRPSNNLSAGRPSVHSGSASTSSNVPVGMFEFCADGPNGAQPATYPGVPSLRITALAGDWHQSFPWPVTVFARHEALPVCVKDVLDALLANFEERLWDEEVCAMSYWRMALTHEAYWRRLKLEVGGRRPPRDDGLRRVDYLGDAPFFRGLAPAPDGEGFMLFVGPPP